jgi:hypothetical protein
MRALRSSAQIVHGIALAAVGVGELGRGRLEIIKARHCLGGASESRMCGDILDALAADIDHASVAEGLKVLGAGLQHAACPLMNTSLPHGKLHYSFTYIENEN